MIVQESKADPELVANILLQKITELKREGVDCDSIDETKFVELFDVYHEGKITKQAIDPILRELAKGKGIKESIVQLKLKRVTGTELKKLISKEKGERRDETIKNIMSKYRLVVDGSELNDALGKGPG